jgi:hypothetical protein
MQCHCAELAAVIQHQTSDRDAAELRAFSRIAS